MSSTLVQEENKLFFKRWLTSPKQLGTFAPISQRLAINAAKAVLKSYNPDCPLIEIGAGTGRLTRALINEGIPARNIIAIELDENLAHFLKKNLPMVQVIAGDAAKLQDYIPEFFGKLPLIVSVLPLMYFSQELRKDIVQVMLNALKESEGNLYHVTYSPISPLKAIKDRIDKNFEEHRVVNQWLNLPPGFVWHYKRLS